MQIDFPSLSRIFLHMPIQLLKLLVLIILIFEGLIIHISCFSFILVTIFQLLITYFNYEIHVIN